MRTVSISLLSIAATLVAAVPARAEYLYVFDQTDYLVGHGKELTVKVYLQETGTALLRDTGLVNVGVTVCWNDAPIPLDAAMVQEDDDVAPDSHFPVIWEAATFLDEGCARLRACNFAPIKAAETAPGSGVYRLLLGTFTFTAGDIGAEITHLRATDYQSDSNDTTTPFLNEEVITLDSSIGDGTATITTASAPEPSGLVLGILLLLTVAGSRLVGRRRR